MYVIYVYIYTLYDLNKDTILLYNEKEILKENNIAQQTKTSTTSSHKNKHINRVTAKSKEW